ncbi:fatty acid desaturase [Cohnella yongneupensis]|uniref:Fatty acid desaturase n=1 Tax=Cohnella yongneupensis TaxID=425006 RepID=A0ABW0QXD1_9BACL
MAGTAVKKKNWSDNSGGSTYKDYSLLGKNTKLAHEKGLVAAEWYTSPIDRKRLKELMKRKDWPGIRDTIIMFAALIGTGWFAVAMWGTWWSVLGFIVYGFIYYTCCNSRWHELGHYTAFKTKWINEALYYLTSWMIMRPGTIWRWEHSRHHTDTAIVGRDPQIFVPRPPGFRTMMLNALQIDLFKREFMRAIRHSFKKMDESERDIVPASELPKVYREARLYVLGYLAVIGVSIYMGSIIPLLLFGLPCMYGAWLSTTVFFVMEHGGLDEDVLDHRMVARTVYLNPVLRFLHWNMNYHIEHHMFPMVPYHALPALHKEIKKDCPEPLKGIWAVIMEIYPVFLIQHRDPSYTIVRPLPPTARPYSPNGAYKEPVQNQNAAVTV